MTTYTGTSGNDVIIDGATGNHVAYGGAGNDTIQFYGGNHSIFGGDGNDTLTGGSGNDYIVGGNNIDYIYGGAGDDTIYGGSGDDIYAGDGNDIMIADAYSLQPDTTRTTGVRFIGGDTGNGDYDTLDLRSYVAYRPFGSVTASVDADGNSTSSVIEVLDQNGNWIRLTYVEIENLLLPPLYVAPDGTVEGTSGADLIDINYTGDPEGDVVDGADGLNDRIYAYGGNDRVYAGSGSDYVDGGAGNDTLDGGIGSDTIYGGTGNDTIYGGSGTYSDKLYGGAGNDLIYGGAGHDTITGSNGNDTLYGDAGNDLIYGGSGDVIYGGDDSDTIDISANTPDGFGSLTSTITVDGGTAGTTDNDTLDLTAFISYRNLVQTTDADGDSTSGSVQVQSSSGWTTINFTEIENLLLPPPYSTLNGTVSGTTGNDFINTSYTGDPQGDKVDNNDAILSGHSGNDDLIDAGAGNDTISAGAGNDTVYGGTGNDTLMASAGNDTFYGGNDSDRLVLVDGMFNGEVFFGGEGGNDLDIIDTPYSSTTDKTVVLSGSGQGTISDSTGTATFYQVEAIYTSFGSDYIDASADLTGMDLSAGGGNDTVIGGSGNDWLIGDMGNDTLYGGAGDDGIEGGAGNDSIYAGTGNDTVYGGDLNDLIYGGDGDDRIFGGADSDIIYGGAGNDTIYTYTLSGADQSADSVDGGAGNDTIIGNFGDDTIAGGDGNDEIFGGDGNDDLSGGLGTDTISGDTGNDTLHFAQGDTADGGDGDDLFTLENLGETGNGTITVTGGNLGETAGGGDTLQLGDLADLSTLNITDTTVNGSGNTSYTGTVTLDDGTTLNFSQIENIVCFARGTYIKTIEGEVRIEDLRPGMRVLTVDRGFQTLRWVGSSTVLAVGKLAPIRFETGVLGNDRPIFVSPQHRMFMCGWAAELIAGEAEVLVPAVHLVNGTTITRQEGGEIEYFHMLFDQHELVFSNGCISESFHPGEQGWSALCEAARAEILTLFPDLEQTVFASYGSSARYSVCKTEAYCLSQSLAADEQQKKTSAPSYAA
ncbi:hypothetical protein EU803_15220 [Loktanella sp. IMCC34160]|uniref:Hint domain-containing protein n=1 Tax=Loktanella sp. IMCC34160 TaxID=2510646 RepID=UPI00101D485F|nr:Hint domain-containing protein [Loktanella sp. IMCC34160]RYG89967.1 hypothetical protein EU803_15220 [Loktanella sp. IMCC34160]